MRRDFKKIVVVSLGGSIMYPDRINYDFLRRFRRFIMPLARKRRFIIVAGGGRLSRLYQEAAAKVTRVTDEDRDWLGIHATRSNAHLLRTIFREIADPVVVDGQKKVGAPRYPVTIASGWRPGWSTDFIAVAIAEKLGVKEVIIAGKPSHVYDKDFTKHKDAKQINEISWKKYRRLIPAKWSPGLHSPVDPVGARLAERRGIVAVIINGKDLKNFGRLLSGGDFKGTLIG